MITTKVFKSGNSLAIRLPKELAFAESEEVEMFKRGDDLIIRNKPKSLKEAFFLLAGMSDDFMLQERQDMPLQERNFEWE